eukprot:COSAG06_NODE_4090_length_4585_cov_2.219795_6_plen_103_part_00
MLQVATQAYFKEFKESAEKGHDWHGGTLTFYGFGGSKYDITVYGYSGNSNPFATGMKAYMIAEVGPQMRNRLNTRSSRSSRSSEAVPTTTMVAPEQTGLRRH